MVIQCTQKLIRQMGMSVKPLSHIGKIQYPDGLFDWHAGAAVFGEEKGIVLMNNLTRYPIAVTKWDAAAAMQGTDFWKGVILEALQAEGIHPEVTAAYGKNCASVSVERACDHEIIGRLIHTVREVGKRESLLRQDRIVQTALSCEAARCLMRYEEGFDTPANRLFEALTRWKDGAGLTKTPLFDIEMWVLNAEWRNPDGCAQIAVPASIPFYLLHEILARLTGRAEEERHIFLEGDMVVEEKRELREISMKSKISYCYGAFLQDSIVLTYLSRQSHKTKDCPAVLSLSGKRLCSATLAQLNQELEWVMRR